MPAAESCQGRMVLHGTLVLGHVWPLTSTGPPLCLALLVSQQLSPPGDCSSNCHPLLSSKPPSFENPSQRRRDMSWSLRNRPVCGSVSQADCPQLLLVSGASSLLSGHALGLASPAFRGSLYWPPAGPHPTPNPLSLFSAIASSPSSSLWLFCQQPSFLKDLTGSRAAFPHLPPTPLPAPLPAPSWLLSPLF